MSVPYIDITSYEYFLMLQKLLSIVRVWVLVIIFSFCSTYIRSFDTDILVIKICVKLPEEGVLPSHVIYII